MATLVAALFLSATVPVHADLTLSEQRSAYLEADRMLSQGKVSAWLRMKPQLKRYPLYHNLIIKEVRATHSQYSNRQIAKIISRVDVPLPGDFRRWWLKRLKDDKDWDLIIRFYANSTSTETQCTVALAILRSRSQEEADSYIKPLWLVGRSQPKQCDALFNSALSAGIVDDELIWQRILLSQRSNQSSMTNYLSGLLQSADIKWWVKQLKNTHQDPRTTIKRHLAKWSESPYGRDVITYGLVRITRLNTDRGISFWQSLQSSHPDAVGRLTEAERQIAQILGWRRHQLAYGLLANLPEPLQDPSIRQLMVRNALAKEDWDSVLSAINLMPDSETQANEWRYWRARALYETGNRPLAESILAALAKDRDFYGFLAADQLGLDYNLSADASSASQSVDRHALLEAEPALARIREWLALRRPYSARRELTHLRHTRRGDGEFWHQAALLFHSWDWHDGAIRATFASGRASDFELALSHPSPYLNYARREAIRNNVPQHWILGIMRQESLFIHDIRSGAGAVGLMQLMPATARSVAKRNKLKRPSTKDLSSASLNIRLGTHYFRQLLDRSDGNPIYSLAGYNAGPKRVDQWRQMIRVKDPAVWVESIPYKETRNYIKKILVNFIVYDNIHNARHARIRDYLKVTNSQHASVAND